MKVYNKKFRDAPPDAVYVGRGTPWGNPYKVGYASNEYSRSESLKLYEEYALRRLAKDPRWLDPLRDKDLVCHCKPLPCHADCLVRLLRDNP